MTVLPERRKKIHNNIHKKRIMKIQKRRGWKENMRSSRRMIIINQQEKAKKINK